MEIAALIIISILSGCIGYLISSTMKHVHEAPQHININHHHLVKHRVQVETELYTQEDIAIDDLACGLKRYVTDNKDFFIERHEEQEKRYWTFEFYTKNK